jgi:hypothetical protein
MRTPIVILAACLVAACTTRPYRFSVWPNVDKASPQATSQRVEDAAVIDHPCGWVREIEVTRLPPPGSIGHVAGTETVVEFDANGNILRRWSLPVDAFPLAIDGALLEFGYGRGAFVVDAKGRLRETAYRERPSEAITCPSAVEAEYRGSEFLICVRLNDLGSNASRNLAFEGVCT